MTYTIVGRCPRTKQLGIGITTWSLGVGGYCPFIKSKLAALSSQAAADPRLGQLAMRLLGLGYSPAKVMRGNWATTTLILSTVRSALWTMMAMWLFIRGPAHDRGQGIS